MVRGLRASCERNMYNLGDNLMRLALIKFIQQPLNLPMNENTKSYVQFSVCRWTYQGRWELFFACSCLDLDSKMNMTTFSYGWNFFFTITRVSFSPGFQYKWTVDHEFCHRSSTVFPITVRSRYTIILTVTALRTHCEFE